MISVTRSRNRDVASRCSFVLSTAILALVIVTSAFVQLSVQADSASSGGSMKGPVVGLLDLAPLLQIRKSVSAGQSGSAFDGVPLGCPGTPPRAADCESEPSDNHVTGMSPTLGLQLSQISPHSPAGSSLGALAEDPSVGGAVYFGGETEGGPSNETWLFVNGTWSQAGPAAVVPPARFGALMTFDSQPGVDEVVLFGGCGVECPYQDTWLFNGSRWRELSPSIPEPTGVFDGTMANWGPNGTLVFGGCRNLDCTEQSNSTWAFQNTTQCQAQYSSPCWVRLSTLGSHPPGLAGAAMTVDPDFGPPDGTAILYGGFNTSCAACARTDSDSTWLFSGASWQNATSGYDGGPYPVGGRSFAALFWDPGSGEIYLFGGLNDSTGISTNETWESNVDSWVRLTTSVDAPTAGNSFATASGVTLLGGKRLPPILFGGNTSNSSPDNQTWIFETSLDLSGDILPATISLSGRVETNVTVSFFSNVTGGFEPTSTWNLGPLAPTLSGNGSYSYIRPGLVRAELDGVDRYGVEATWSSTFDVALFGVTITAPTVVDAGSPTTLSVIANGTPPYNITWSRTGSTFAYGPVTAANFSTVGPAQLGVEVSDETGSVVSIPFTISVSPPLGGSASFLPPAVDIGSRINLSASGQGGTPPYSVSWALPNGRSASGGTLSFIASSVGQLKFTVYITDSANGAWSAVRLLNVTSPLSASAGYSGGGLFAGRTIGFQSSVTGGLPPYSFEWSFGDGTWSNQPDPSHSYNSARVYTAQLWVNDSAGSSFHLTLSVDLPRTSGGLLWNLQGFSAWELAAAVGSVAVASAVTLVLLRRQKSRASTGGLREPPLASPRP